MPGERSGGLLRRNGADPADPPSRVRVGAAEAAGATARDLQQERRGALPVRRLRRARRPASRPDASPQERARGPGVLPPDPDALPPKIRIYLIADNLCAHKPPTSASGPRTTTSSSSSPPPMPAS